jgi:DNA-binding MarR family transcriptional regulator
MRYLILAAQREGNRRLMQDLRSIDLTPSQAEAIRIVGDHGPLSQSGLGELLICETGTNPSRLVDRLVGMGLMARDASREDRRQITLSLTPEGQRSYNRVREGGTLVTHAVDRSGVLAAPLRAALRGLADLRLDRLASIMQDGLRH